MAEGRDQNPGVWFVLGFLAPGLAHVVLAVAFDRVHAPDAQDLTETDAVCRDPTARALGARSGRGVDELAEATSRSETAVAADLRTLQSLGLAEDDVSGRWMLTDERVATLESDAAAHGEETSPGAVDPDLPLLYRRVSTIGHGVMVSSAQKLGSVLAVQMRYSPGVAAPGIST